jgi:tetratricopeptide (TPR) repeat protein
MDSAPRSPKAQAEEKKTPAQTVAEFLKKNRIALLALFGLVAAAVIGVAVWTSIRSAAVKASSARIEKLDEDFLAFKGEQDLAKKAQLEKTLVASADEMFKKWPRLLAGQRAAGIKARVLEEKKDWAGAEKEWLASANSLPTSYFAPIALQRAAASAEERDAPEKAAEYYLRVVDKYASKTVGIPHAYFALGRLAEQAQDFAGAAVYYEKIVSVFPDDDWTKLAKDRILSMKSRSLAK